MIFDDDLLCDVPLLSEWSIVLTGRGPRLIGVHAFHEGQRAVAETIVAVDPTLKWVLTDHGGYKLAGGGTEQLLHLQSPYAKEKH